MSNIVQRIDSGEMESYLEQSFAETPFADPTVHEQERPQHDISFGETFTGNWEFNTPFLPGESGEAGESETAAPEVAAFGEMVGELKDGLFRESLEQLADEALEAHSAQLAGEYGDRETRDNIAERLLNDHFAPLAAESEAMLEHFFERLEGFGAESLTDSEIDRMASEVVPSVPMSPASEQFLGGLLRKAGKLVSGAVNLAKKGVSGAINLAGKGLAAIGKLALGPLLAPLKMLGKFLLQHVVRFALGQLPPTLRPLAQKLSDRLFRAVGETHEGELEEHEQSESEAAPAAHDAARLEAEFDVHAAQLLLTADEAEMDHLVSSYGEGEGFSSPLPDLDNARAQFVKELAQLESGQNPQPVMEQFIPAMIWPAAKTAITILGRPKLVSFLARLLSGLVKPLIGAGPAELLAPAIADAGLRIFGLETNTPEPREMAAEALAASIEETLNTVAEMPPHVLENETLLSDAVHEAFENAASSYFPNSIIKPELHESAERHGMWTRMPARSGRKRYAKYSDSVPVEISPRTARSVDTFGTGTLHDHLRDHYGVQDGRPYKAKISLYQALPGTRGSTIARAEGFPVSQLHPLTPQAAGALLGRNASLGLRQTPGSYLNTPQKLHVNQRLYRIEPPHGHRHHPRRTHSELAINLSRGEIRLWLYLSEPLCQRISADLAAGNNSILAFGHLKRLVTRITDSLKTAMQHRHLPHHIYVISDRPNINGTTPNWLRHSGHHLGVKIREWLQVQLAQYLRNNAEEFKRSCASHSDGVTLRITMSRIPGIEHLRQMAHGKVPKELLHGKWPTGSPAFQVVQHSGYKIHKLRD
jgi:hypothetical protein